MYRRVGGSVEVVLGEQVDRLNGARNTRLPKGKVDPGESLEETAVREVREETGFAARVAGSLGAVAYSFCEGRTRVAKEVHFFLMEHGGGEPAPRDGELERVFWCPIETAAQRLSFETERDVLARAREQLEGGA